MVGEYVAVLDINLCDYVCAVALDFIISQLGSCQLDTIIPLPMVYVYDIVMEYVVFINISVDCTIGFGYKTHQYLVICLVLIEQSIFKFPIVLCVLVSLILFLWLEDYTIYTGFLFNPFAECFETIVKRIFFISRVCYEPCLAG